MNNQITGSDELTESTEDTEATVFDQFEGLPQGRREEDDPTVFDQFTSQNEAVEGNTVFDNLLGAGEEKFNPKRQNFSQEDFDASSDSDFTTRAFTQLRKARHATRGLLATGVGVGLTKRQETLAQERQELQQQMLAAQEAGEPSVDFLRELENIDRSIALNDRRISESARIISDAAQSQYDIDGQVIVSPATKKLQNGDLESIGQALSMDAGSIGDIALQMVPQLAGNVAAAALTRGSSLPVQIAAQSGVEGAMTALDELNASIQENGGEPLDMRDPEIVETVIRNLDQINEAIDKSAKAGLVGSAGGFLGTLLAGKGLIKLSSLQKASGVKRAGLNAADATGTVAAQAAVGAGTEAAIAEAADRDLTALDLAAGTAFGVASGAVDAGVGGIRRNQALRQIDNDGNPNNQTSFEEDPDVQNLKSEFTEIFGDDVEPAPTADIDAPIENIDTAPTDDVNATITPSQVDATEAIPNSDDNIDQGNSATEDQVTSLHDVEEAETFSSPENIDEGQEARQNERREDAQQEDGLQGRHELRQEEGQGEAALDQQQGFNSDGRIEERGSSGQPGEAEPGLSRSRSSDSEGNQRQDFVGVLDGQSRSVNEDAARSRRVQEEERKDGLLNDSSEDIPLTSRGRVGHGRAPGQPVSTGIKEFNPERVEQAIDDTARFINETNTDKIEVFNSKEDLPDGDIKDYLRQRGEGTTGIIPGLYDPSSDKIYLFKDRFKDADDLRSTALHEASHAVRRGPGPEAEELRSDLRKLFEDIGGEPGLRKFFNDNGIDMTPYERNFAGMSEEDFNFLMTDEVVAQIHGRENGPNKQLARRILLKLEDFLKKLGLDIDVFDKVNTSKLSAEFQRYIAKSERVMRESNDFSQGKMGILYPKVNRAGAGAGQDFASDLREFTETIVGTIPEITPAPKLRRKINTLWGRYMDRTGNLGEEAFLRGQVFKKGEIRKARNISDTHSRLLQEVVKDNFKGKASRTEAYEKATDYLTTGEWTGKGKMPEDMKTVLDVMRRNIDDGSRKVNVALSQQLGNAVRRLQDSDPETHENLSSQVKDALSKPELFGADGRPEEYSDIPQFLWNHMELMSTLSNNEGSYLRTSYQAFNDPSYFKHIDENRELLEPWADQWAEKFDVRVDEARTDILNMLKNAGGRDAANFFGGEGNSVGINKATFKAKHLKDPLIKEILGEYRDVRMNYHQTMSNLATIAANHDAQVNIRAIHGKTGLIAKEKSTSQDGRWNISEELFPSDPMSVLHGMYADKEVANTLEYWAKGNDLHTKGFIFKQMLKWGALVNKGKTVYSPPTQVANVVSNFFIQMGNGHLFYRQSTEGHSVPSRAEIWKIASNLDKPENAELRDRLLELGVISDSVALNEISDLIGDEKGFLRKYWEDNIVDPDNDTAVSKAGQLGDAALRKAEWAYAFGDDVFKIEGYLIELDKMKRFKGLEGAAAEEAASRNVHEQYLMYSQTNRLVNNIRSVPMLGLFVSFPAELMRVSKNQIKYAFRDYVDPDIPKGVAMGRLIGLTSSYTAMATIAKGSALAMGISSEEEEEFRKTLPEWAQQNDILYLGRYENGDPRFIDVSRFNPYAMFIKATRQLIKTNDDGFVGSAKNLTAAAGELASPFWSPNILAASLAELGTGFNLSTGSRITNPVNDDVTQAMDRGMQFIANIMPGAVTQGINIFDSHVNDKKWYGGENSSVKAWAKMFGLNVGRMDRDISLRFYAKSFTRTKRNARTVINREMNDLSGRPDYADIKKSLFTRLDAETQNYEDGIKMIEVMRQMGLSNNKIRAVLKSQYVSAGDTKALLNGEMPKLELTGKEGLAAKRTALSLVDDPSEVAQIENDYKLKREMLRKAYNEWLTQ